MNDCICIGIDYSIIICMDLELAAKGAMQTEQRGRSPANQHYLSCFTS